MTAPRFIWRVYAFKPDGYFQREFLASFFEHRDARHFASECGRSAYIDAGRYDRRVAGYRPEQIVEVEHLGPGRIAA